MDFFLKETYLNQEVQIYPGDTYYKYGIVRNISEAGVVFEITCSNDDSFRKKLLLAFNTMDKEGI